MKQKIAILGSTGSIGSSLLNIIKRDKNKFQIVLLTTNKNYKKILLQARLFNVKNLLISNKNIYNKLDLTISFFHFQILLISITLILRNIFFIFQDFLVKSFVFSHYNKNSKNLFVLYASSEFIKFYKQGIDYYIKNLNKETWYAYVGILYGILYILIDFIYFLIIVFSGLYLISIENISNIFLSILLFFSLVSVLLIKIKKKGC